MFTHAARVAPEKAVLRPALPMCSLPGISEMQMKDNLKDVPDQLEPEDIVLPFQPEVRCYTNREGSITILAIDMDGTERYVAVPMQAARPLAARLIAIADVSDALDAQEVKERN